MKDIDDRLVDELENLLDEARDFDELEKRYDELTNGKMDEGMRQWIRAVLPLSWALHQMAKMMAKKE